MLNKLKTQAASDWLTDCQWAAFDDIRNALRFPEIVNVHGPVGSGKTFLAWTLGRRLEIPYFPSLAAFDERCEHPTTPGHRGQRWCW